MHTAKYQNAARTCDLVFANSAFTARDVVELLGVPEGKVRVALPGVDEVFTSEGAKAELGGDYVLTVATLEPRKNLAALVEAQASLGRDDLLLAVVGAEGRASSRRSTGSGSSGSATWTTTSWPASTAERPSSRTRRASRASGCR